MTTTPMCADTAIRFRDPFASKDRHQAYPSTAWSVPSRRAASSRPFTPPLEMNSIARSPKHTLTQHQHAQHFDNYLSAQQPPATSHSRTKYHHYSNSVKSAHMRNTTSPEPAVRHVAPAEDTHSHSRQGSQVDSIAPSFQIPKSVNDSGGSLSELAAQMTCLFWFESSDVLQQIEDSPIPLQPLRQLANDARPTTGFRKWVTTILSTTCVAQNVVLLALLFVHRLKKLNPTVRGKPGSEYRLLTVALMLGNKFLDDNTYTNKTWAEVSGINVAEVHIMEVEFLSNMKYCLFTSAEDWTRWQSLLGKFAAFFDRASRPQPVNPPAPILPPPSSLHLPVSLPSPPASNQASPPYITESQNGSSSGSVGVNGMTPAPSPLELQQNSQQQSLSGRKRSIDEYAIIEPPAKRIATNYPNYQHPHNASNPPSQVKSSQQNSRLTLPSLSISTAHPPAGGYSQMPAQVAQLPPLTVPARAMGLVFPPTTNQPQIPQLPAVTAPSSSLPPSQYQSRQQSPYPGSATGSPMSALPLGAAPLHPPTQLSPTHYYLQHRNSPYRPVHDVSTLTYPPSTSALQQRSQTVEYNQMSYQPLGKPSQQRQSGRLPYVAQNVWLDGNSSNGLQAMTPIQQWPGFVAAQAQAQMQGQSRAGNILQQH